MVLAFQVASKDRSDACMTISARDEPAGTAGRQSGAGSTAIWLGRIDCPLLPWMSAVSSKESTASSNMITSGRLRFLDVDHNDPHPRVLGQPEQIVVGLAPAYIQSTWNK